MPGKIDVKLLGRMNVKLYALIQRFNSIVYICIIKSSQYNDRVSRRKIATFNDHVGYGLYLTVSHLHYPPETQ